MMIASSRKVSTNAVKYIKYGPSMCHFARKMALARTATLSTQNHTHLKDQNFSKSYLPWPTDSNFPLPGNMNIDLKAVQEDESHHNPKRYRTLGDALLDADSDDKRFVLSDFLRESKEYPLPSEKTPDDLQAKISDGEVFSTATIMDSPCKNNKVEFKIQECPPKLKKYFSEFFLKDTLENLTIITISQQTENDMTSWSEDVEAERNLLSEVFIESATKICEKILNCEYWADFIDPMSGLAYYAENPNKTLHETDDCFNQLGFHVEDLGCCKVLQHGYWKNHVFVGLILTNAPIESHLFQML